MEQFSTPLHRVDLLFSPVMLSQHQEQWRCLHDVSTLALLLTDTVHVVSRALWPQVASHAKARGAFPGGAAGRWSEGRVSGVFVPSGGDHHLSVQLLSPSRSWWRRRRVEADWWRPSPARWAQQALLGEAAPSNQVPG